jgi:hypothetical protein
VPNPQEILRNAFQRASTGLTDPLIDDSEITERIERVCRNLQNRALARLLLACALAKSLNPGIDIRKPYTEIGDADSFSGRTYDEAYIAAFVQEHGLPCNPTTAFLTPALRNINQTLTPETVIAGRPPLLYKSALQLLTDVQTGAVSAEDLLAETVRSLLVFKNEQHQRMETLLAGIKTTEGAIPLSAEAIVTLVEQHLKSPRSSRLPVLIVAAAYQAAAERLGEQARPLESHNAADRQTGSIGDVEVTLVDEDQVVTGYEMKMRRVTQGDIDIALQKIIDKNISNYIFITTDVIDREVREYAAGLYERTGGIEVVVLDCISFLRHFLHLFHRIRMKFVQAYQQLILDEPDSAIGQPLKETWLALRQAAESGLEQGDSLKTDT